MIFCFDIDHTIYSHKTMQLSARILSALSELKERGHYVILASGRDLTADLSARLVDAICPDGLVHCNGLHVVFHGEKIMEHYFDKEKMRQILDYADKRGLVVGAFTNAGSYFTHVDQMPPAGQGYLKHSKRIMEESERELFISQPVIAMSYLGEEEQLRKMQQDLGGIWYYMFSNNGGADVMDTQMAKADGIEQLHKKLGMGWKDTICFGDSMNDLEMIRRAGRGIAVANALDKVKENADLVVGSVDEDGVAQYLEKEFLHD